MVGGNTLVTIEMLQHHIACKQTEGRLDVDLQKILYSSSGHGISNKQESGQDIIDEENQFKPNLPCTN